MVLDGHTTNPGDLSWEAIARLGNLKVYPVTPRDNQSVVQRAADAEIVITNKTVITAELMAQLPKLEYIGLLSTGTNAVDLEYAGAHGITVANVPGYSTDSVAQMVFAHILNICNEAGRYADETRRGEWARQESFCYWTKPLTELAGKRMGIVGMGNTGSKVAQIALAFGMEVSAATSKPADRLPRGVESVSMDTLLATSDFLSLHCPLTPQTRGMVDAAAIAKMKRGAVVVNTARGPLVCEGDICTALDSGQLSHYCADVLETEPPTPGSPLSAHPKAMITPHIAWATKEARTRLIGQVARNIEAYLEGKPVNVVS